MTRKNLPDITRSILKSGRSPDTPAAVVYRGTTRYQKTVTGTLSTIADIVEQASLESPIVLIIGEVVTLRSRITWFE